MPVMNLPSSLAERIVSQRRSVDLQLRLHLKSNNARDLPRNKAAFATSVGSVSLPSGTFPKKFLTFSGVNGTPTNVSNRPVPLNSGRRLLTRICLGPYSAASPLVAYHEQALVSKRRRKEVSSRASPDAQSAEMPQDKRYPHLQRRPSKHYTTPSPASA